MKSPYNQPDGGAVAASPVVPNCSVLGSTDVPVYKLKSNYVRNYSP